MIQNGTAFGTTTRRAIKELIEICPKLEISDQFIERLQNFDRGQGSVELLKATLTVLRSAADQNVRVARKYDYVRLETAAKDLQRVAQEALDSIS